MAKKQKIILNDLAKKHNISIGQAEEIFSLFVDKIATTISEEDKMEDGLYVADRFKTIHIDNFGKFIPNLNKITYANKYLQKKKNGH
jgi:nucleoid DNA-binding protein